MALLVVDGPVARSAVPTSLAAAGLQERAHLQEWVIAHPDVLGPDLLIVTSEYDRWEGTDGVTARDRLDVLALDANGRLVVVELKRGVDRDIHLQAITYAALVSRFDRSTLAQAHGDWLTTRGKPTTTEQAAELLDAHLVEDWDEGALLNPRIVLVAASFPRAVTHTAVWLSQMTLDVTLIEMNAWRIGAAATGPVVVDFHQLYPPPEVGEFTLAPARQRVEEATERAEERTRAVSTVRRLLESDALAVGAPLQLDLRAASAAERTALELWVAASPERGTASWTGDAAAPLRWGHDGTTWRPTPLVRHILGEAGLPAGSVRGPAWWMTSNGVDLASLADGSPSGRRDWSDLHGVLARLPAGRWTTYGDLADLVDTHANPLGGHLTRCTECVNAHRVLSAGGRVADNFAWSDPSAHTSSPRQMLEAEGVHFTVAGAADEGSRLTRDELESLLQTG